MPWSRETLTTMLNPAKHIVKPKHEFDSSNQELRSKPKKQYRNNQNKKHNTEFMWFDQNWSTSTGRVAQLPLSQSQNQITSLREL